MLNKPLVMLGAGGHAKVLLSILQQQRADIFAVCAPQPPASILFQQLRYLAHDDDILQFSPQQVMLVNGVGALPGQTLRRKLYERFSALGYQFACVIAGSAVIADSVKLFEGVQVLPGAIVNADAQVDANVLINSGAIVEHDCILGIHSIISPGAVLCGGVSLGENCYIGAGATVIQGIQLGNNTLAGAGSTVVRNLLDNQSIYCAQPFIKG